MITCRNCGEKDLIGDNRKWARSQHGWEHVDCKESLKTWVSDHAADALQYMAAGNQTGKKSFQSHLNEYLTEVSSYSYNAVAPLYEKKIKYEPATDRPTLAQRLDAMEEKYKKECAFKRQLEHDYGILQDKYTNLRKAYDEAAARISCASVRLAQLDVMGADLEKIRGVIGTKEFKRILDGDK